MQKLTSTDQMKLRNTRQVLQEIVHHPGICRKEITENVGLSPQTVTNLVKELLDRGVVQEQNSQGQLQRGRTPVELRFCAERFRMLTAVASWQGICVMLHTLDGQLLCTERAPLSDGKANLEALCRLSLQLSDRCKADGCALLAELISVEGVVNEATGVVLRATVLEWVQQDLRAALGELNIPILVQNDVNLVAQALCLSGPNDQNSIVVKLDNGIGSAFVLNGKMLRSVNNVAGEMGHVTVHAPQENYLCPCGKRNCLTQYISIPSLERRYGKPVDQLYRDCCDGVPLACEMADGLVGYLAPLLANLVGLLDLDAVFFIGRTSLLFENRLFPAMEQEIRSRLSSWSGLKQIRRIEECSPIQAAALVVLDDCLSKNQKTQHLLDTL